MPLFVLDRGQPIVVAVMTVPIVEKLDVIEHLRPGFIMGRVYLPFDFLRFQ